MLTTMETLATLLLEYPSAVLESGVVIPCALQDLAPMALADRTCMFRSESSSPADGDALPRIDLYPAGHALRYEANTERH